MNGQSIDNYPVDEDWQRHACDVLGLDFVRPVRHKPDGPDVILTRPDLRSLKSIRMDGNCLFRKIQLHNNRL